MKRNPIRSFLCGGNGNGEIKKKAAVAELKYSLFPILADSLFILSYTYESLCAGRLFFEADTVLSMLECINASVFVAFLGAILFFFAENGRIGD